MFVNKVESGKGELEIVYDVQWKTPGNDDDKAKIIGIVDTPDTKLDWKTFKSYLIQNSGNMSFTTNDIRISYLDSDDDLIPVDSELEFRECLKFSRIRARKGSKIIMKVNMVSNGGAKPKELTKYNEEPSSKHINPKLFCLKKKDMNPKILLKKPVENAKAKDPAPEWFEKYMAQFKAELVQEITSAVVANVRATLSNNGATVSGNPGVTSSSQTNTAPSSSKGHHYNHPLHLIDKRKKKKKMLEEDSSDCTDGLQLQWEERLELLRHMQKINKREKKFEKKLDATLEKLDSKRKKLMEKKYSFSKKNGVFSLPQTSATLPSSQSVPPAPISSELVMDATPVDEYNYVPHVFCGELVHQVWKVMNDGQLPWTEETELRFAWGSKSLVPLTPVVKCPLLKPGETGKVKVTLQSPLIPGNFESYWHFHHQGRRFGQWLGCAVIVDPDPRPSAPPLQSDALKDLENAFGLCSVDQGPLPVDLTMKCQQSYPTEYNRTSTTDDMKIYNIETKPEVEKSEQESANLLQQSPIKPEEPKVKETDTNASNDASSVASSLDSTRCVAETELEEFPRLESYTSKAESSFISDSFPDLVQRNDDSVMNKPDLNSWAQYVPHGNNSEIVIADLLNIKDESVEGSEKNLHSGVKYENILPNVENLSTKSYEKKSSEDPSVAVDLEYVSGSDSDNISIISGTVSLDSEDTEPSDDFVVVPMPTCINCDQPLEQHGCVPIDLPISVEIPHTPSDSSVSAHGVQLQTSDNNNNTQSSAACLPVLQTEEQSMQATEIPTKTEPESNEEQKSSDDENTVYVRDKSGNSIPVAKVVRSRKNSAESPKPVEQPNVGFGIGVGIRHSIFGDPAFGQGPNGPRFPFSFGNDSPNSPPHCHNPGGPCNFRPQHESPSYSAGASNMSFSANDVHSKTFESGSGSNETFCSHFCPKDKQQSYVCSPKRHIIHKIIQHQKYKQQQPKTEQCLHRQSPQQPKVGQYLYRQPPSPPKVNACDAMYQQQEMAASASNVTRASAYHNIHTEQPRACKYSYRYNSGVQDKSATNSTAPGSSSSRRSSSDSRETSPVAAAVQILPETLVTGAVNVASSAINTARSVIDMLRPRHEEPAVAQWGQVTPAMENSLRTLSEMGFNNRELNVMLLSQNGNDVARVICKLVQ